MKQAYVESMPKHHQRFKVQENIELANRVKEEKKKHGKYQMTHAVAFNPILANENWGFKLKPIFIICAASFALHLCFCVSNPMFHLTRELSKKNRANIFCSSMTP